MAYTKQTWTNDVSKLNATRLNYIEDGIEAAVASPASVASGECAVWNGSAWVRSTVTKLGISSLSTPASQASGETIVWNGSSWVRSSVTQLGTTSIGTGTPGAGKYVDGAAGAWTTLPTTGPTFTYGTTPPGSPVGGDIWYCVDSITLPTFQWAFRYNDGSSNTDKWEFVGGLPKIIAVDTFETTTSDTAVDLATVGPTFTVPRAGVYQLRVYASTQNDTAGANYADVYYKVGSAAAVAIMRAGNASANTLFVNAVEIGDITVAASTAVKMQYSRNAGGTASFRNRKMVVTPVRVS